MPRAAHSGGNGSFGRLKRMNPIYSEEPLDFPLTTTCLKLLLAIGLDSYWRNNPQRMNPNDFFPLTFPLATMSLHCVICSYILIYQYLSYKFA